MGSLEKIILISAGDPASIAPEITVKAIQCLLDDARLKPIVISNPNLIKNMTDEEAIEYLSNLRQIGRWSAEMILLFTFNRSNIWPLQDIGLLRAISNNYNKKYFPPKIFLNKLYKKFTPYCSVATWYLWRSIDNEPIQY